MLGGTAQLSFTKGCAHYKPMVAMLVAQRSTSHPSHPIPSQSRSPIILTPLLIIIPTLLILAPILKPLLLPPILIPLFLPAILVPLLLPPILQPFLPPFLVRLLLSTLFPAPEGTPVLEPLGPVPDFFLAAAEPVLDAVLLALVVFPAVVFVAFPVLFCLSSQRCGEVYIVWGALGG